MDNRKIFNKIAEKYHNEWNGNSKEKNNIKKIIKFSKIKKGEKILEPGCGKGDFSKFILKKIGKNGLLYLVDVSDKMLKYAKSKLKKYRNVKFINQDIINIKKIKKEFFDKIICFNCFPHFYPKEKIIKKIYSLLKDNGILIIAHSIPRKKVNKIHKEFGFDMRKHNLPSVKSLCKLLTSLKFEILKKQDKEFYFIKAKK